MDPNPLTFVLQDFDSAAPMALDSAMDLSLNSCCKFISPDSILRPTGTLTRNPNEEETPTDMEFDEKPWNFRVWDLNTSNPELENGTLAEILKSILSQTKDCMSYDTLLSAFSVNLSVDAFDFRDMKSALEEGNVDRLSDILGGLGISGRNSRV